MYVCVCLCSLFVCACFGGFICRRMCIFARACVFICVCLVCVRFLFVCVRKCVLHGEWLGACVCTCVFTRLCPCACGRVCIPLSLSLSLCVCVCVSVYVFACPREPPLDGEIGRCIYVSDANMSLNNWHACVDPVLGQQEEGEAATNWDDVVAGRSEKLILDGLSTHTHAHT